MNGRCECCGLPSRSLIHIDDIKLCLSCNASWRASAAFATAEKKLVKQEDALKQFVEGCACQHYNNR